VLISANNDELDFSGFTSKKGLNHLNLLGYIGGSSASFTQELKYYARIFTSRFWESPPQRWRAGLMPLGRGFGIWGFI